MKLARGAPRVGGPAAGPMVAVGAGVMGVGVKLIIDDVEHPTTTIVVVGPVLEPRSPFEARSTKAIAARVISTLAAKKIIHALWRGLSNHRRRKVCITSPVPSLDMGCGTLAHRQSCRSCQYRQCSLRCRQFQLHPAPDPAGVWLPLLRLAARAL
jgi:hypothetical protein